ncbi:hypothetical protein GCM10009676_15370 [Prauserella halophila]|uniref:Abortive phage infection protein C-terminal domain-containing protein n=1 Tax=Prauserella halophila TaxID=185641 RepID=A0ABN1W4V4_9PSEU|nr:AIPR family protein [Prauserella halophila]
MIDGVNDQGIDAIAIVDGHDPHVYLVQAKWSQNGRASSDRSTVRELFAGLDLIDDEDFAAFNPRGQHLAAIAKEVMSSGPVPITQVVALMRGNEVTQGFQVALEQHERRFNHHGEVLDHRILLSSDIWASVRQDLAPQPVDLTAELFPWFSVSEPYESYQGIVEAEQIAQWVKHGADLFNLNIRNPLGRTAINNDLIDTLTDEPDHFWYFNNGITVLCDSVDKAHHSRGTPHRKPITLELRNASVVNGAQTVRAVAEAVSTDDNAASAQVGIRVIVTGTRDDFAKRTTKATNRQNRVEARDFVALDPIQAAIIDDMRAELGLEYSVRRSELDPHPSTGFSIVEAACALACAHSDAQYAARIAVALEVLWERDSQGIYDVLFRPQPGPYLLWNAVRVFRSVRENLHKKRRHYTGRAAALIEHGAYLLTHLVFQRLNTETIDEPDVHDWANQATQQIGRLLDDLIPALVEAIDTLHGERAQIRSSCSDSQKSRELAAHVLSSEQPAMIPSKYQKTPARRKRRRPNAVSVLIDKSLLEEGDPLTLTGASATETTALNAWLAADPRRTRATWIPQRSKPILWAADGEAYSPSGLISRMWELAGWDEHPVAVQGTARWATRSGDTLADLAWKALREIEEESESADGSADSD